MEITYRKAEPADAEKMLAYLKQIGGESDNLTFGAAGIPLSAEQEAEILKRFYASETETMLLALEGERIVGNGCVTNIGRARFAHRRELSIAVAKECWGKGVGSGLMERLIEAAKNSGASVIELQVRSDNERAKRLYEKFGFEFFGTFKKFMCVEGEFFDADFMNLYL